MPEKIWIFTERAGAPACTKYMHRNTGIQKSFQHLHAVIGGQIDRKIPELVEKFCKFIPGKLHVIVVQCQRQRMFCRQGWIFFHDEPETVGEETFFPVKFRKKLQHKRKIIKVASDKGHIINTFLWFKRGAYASRWKKDGIDRVSLSGVGSVIAVYGQERKLAWNIFQMILESGRVVNTENI